MRQCKNLQIVSRPRTAYQVESAVTQSDGVQSTPSWSKWSVPGEFGKSTWLPGVLIVVMNSSRTAFLVAALMIAASVSAIVARPTAKLSDELPPISLENTIPRQFGEWREKLFEHLQVVNPQTQETLDRIYSQVLNRIYVNADGYRIMLSLAYGSDQRRALQVHKPELCYPAQGFVVRKNEAQLLTLASGTIPVRRLFAVMGARQEPVTYWFTVGDTTVLGSTQKRLVDLRYGLTGRIPDGVLFRVSSIDGDETRAYRMQDQFVGQLLETLPAAERKRLSGLGEPPVRAGS